jgi:hypothetical protein
MGAVSVAKAGVGSAVNDATRILGGTAFGAAAQLDAAGQGSLALGLHGAATNAFFDGFQTAVLVAVAIHLRRSTGSVVVVALDLIVSWR